MKLNLALCFLRQIIIFVAEALVKRQDVHTFHKPVNYWDRASVHRLAH